MGKIKDERAVEPLIESLRSNSEGVRIGAALSLGMIGDARAVEPLVERIGAPLSLHKALTAALIKIGDQRTLPLLIELSGDRQRAEAAIGSLQQLLETSARDLATDALRLVLTLDNVIQLEIHTTDSACAYSATWTTEERVDVFQVRQLARQELIRRGLEA